MSENPEREDVRHDPAHAAGEPDDWASEGGAVVEGPATHPADGGAADAAEDGAEASWSSDGTED
jgi:hypothetical protein